MSNEPNFHLLVHHCRVGAIDWPSEWFPRSISLWSSCLYLCRFPNHNEAYIMLSKQKPRVSSKNQSLCQLTLEVSMKSGAFVTYIGVFVVIHDGVSSGLCRLGWVFLRDSLRPCRYQTLLLLFLCRSGACSLLHHSCLLLCWHGLFLSTC